jgi:gluconokinase
MRAGIPLDDDDRRPWLDALAAAIAGWIAAARPTVLACSALKRAYRQRLVGDRTDVAFAYLRGTQGLVAARVAARRHEYMPATLLPSQFAALEEPDDAIVLDIARPPAELVERLRRSLGV